MTKPQVVCIPGSVAPAVQRYRPLLDAVGDAAEFHLKDLEVYRGPEPPPAYSIDEELEAVDRLADSKGLTSFHLVAYSGGGFISLAYTATRPGRVRSLAVFEPARIPGELGAEENALFADLKRKLEGLSGAEFMSAFIREQVKPGVEVRAPAGPVSPEMQKRPAGIAALIRAFDSYRFDRDLLRSTRCPVYYAYGDLSHEEQALKAGILARLMPDIQVHRFDGVHHFVPPEMIYTARHARALLDLWQTADESAVELSLE